MKKCTTFLLLQLLIFNYSVLHAQWVRTNGLDNCQVTALTASGSDLYVAVNRLPHYGEIYFSSDNGISWTLRSNGLPNDWCSALATHQIGGGVTKVFAGYSGGKGVFHSSDNGLNWTAVNNGLQFDSLSNMCHFVFSLFMTGSDIFAGCGGKIFRSGINDVNWTKVYSTEAIISSFAFSGINLFAGALEQLGQGSGVLRSTNNGINWTNVLSGNVRDLALCGSNLLALQSSGEGPAHNYSMFRSTNQGVSWDSVFAPCEGWFEVIGANLFYGCNGVYVSIDAATSWADVSNGLPAYLWKATDLTTDGTYLFAGTDNGVWKRALLEMVPVELTSFTATANNKEITLNWSTATELNNQGFEVQRKFGKNDFVTIGSVKGHGTTTSPNNYTYIDKLSDAGKYFYRLKQIDFGGKYEYSQTVEINWSPFTTYKLEQNYPNPFNPTTAIGFGIPEKGNVRMSVLNILGEEIKILLNEQKDAGYHSIDFNGSDLPSGIYFYRLQAGNFIDTKKMLLLK
jgi:hypothetical protein